MIRFLTFGAVELRGPAGQELRSVLAQPKRVALLAYLALHAPRGYVRRDTLLAVFWPESDEARARHALNQAVYALRRSLGEDAILSRGAEELALNPERVWCDALALLDAVRAGRRQEALELFRGELLPGFFLDDTPGFEDWLDGERTRLHAAAAEAAATLATEAEEQGRSAEALVHARRRAALDTTDEVAQLQLIRLLDRSADRAAALRTFEDWAGRLRAEYGLEPSPAMKDVVAGLSGSAEFAKSREPASAQSGFTRKDQSAPGQIAATSSVGSGPGEIPTALDHAATSGEVPTPVGSASATSETQAFATVVDTGREARPGARGRTLGRRLAGAAVLTWVLTTVAFVVWQETAGDALSDVALSPEDRIIVADFASTTTDPTLGHVVAEALRIDLARSRAAPMIEPGQLAAALDRMRRDRATPLDFAAAHEVAVRVGLKAVLDGEIASAGTGYVLTARLVAANGNAVLKAFRETASDSTVLIATIDRLSRSVRREVGEPLRSIRATPSLPALTTSSLPALRKYVDGGAGVLGRDSDWERIAIRLREAIAIDSSFAMAYRKLAAVLSNAGQNRSEQLWAATKAYDHRDGLSEPELSMVITTYHDLRGERELAHYRYRSFLAVNPDHHSMLNNLGLQLNGRRETLAEAESLFHRANAVVRAGIYLGNIAVAQYGQGQTTAARATLDSAVSEFPNNIHVAWLRGRLEFLEGRYRFADSIAEGLSQRRGFLAAHRALELHAATTAVQGRVSRALDRFRSLSQWAETLRRSAAAVTYQVQAAQLLLAVGGDTLRALRMVDAGLARHPLSAMDPFDRPHLALAEFYAQSGRTDRAERELTAYERTVPPDLRPETVLGAALHYGRTKGAIEMARGDFDQAIVSLRRFVSEAPAFWISALPDLGRAYEGAGAPDSAIATYEQYLSARSWGNYAFLPRALPQVLWRLGELYVERGELAKAADSYQRFADLWKDADPELQPRVRLARERSRALRDRIAGGSSRAAPLPNATETVASPRAAAF